MSSSGGRWRVVVTPDGRMRQVSAGEGTPADSRELELPAVDRGEAPLSLTDGEESQPERRNGVTMAGEDGGLYPGAMGFSPNPAAGIEDQDELRRRVEGYRLAARVAAARWREGDRRARELSEEVDFLRSQLQQSRTAEEQLRVLLLETTRALQALAPPAALSLPGSPSPKRRWWVFRRR
jgi:hypothetical protein